MNGDNEFQGFVDFDEVESETYLGDDTFRLDDEWGDWNTDAKTFDPNNDGGEIRGGGGGGCDFSGLDDSLVYVQTWQWDGEKWACVLEPTCDAPCP